MASLPALRSKAKDLGITPAEIRKANTADKLQALIMDAVMNGTTPKAPARKPATPARKARATTPARKTTRTPARKAAAPAKPVRKAAAPVKKVAASNGDAGRHVLGSIDYSNIEGWNARPGSIPDQIVKSLRKHRGDRERVFNALLPDIWNFVGRKMADGSKRTKDSAEEMLKYRISRTAWDFAMKTGQHEKSTNRAEYGQGTRSNGSKPAAKKAAPARRTPAKAKTTPTPTRKRAAAQKPAPRRTAARKPVARTRKPATPVAKKKTRR